MKKILIAISMFLLLGCLGSSTFAENSIEPSTEPTTDTYEYQENKDADTPDFIPEGYYEEINQYILNKNASSSLLRGTGVSYYMPRYNQNSYSQDLLNCSNTSIADGGCALVAMTQVSNSFAGYEKFTPLTANEELKKYITCTMEWATAASKLGFNYYAKVTSGHTNAFESAVETHLDAGRRIIVCLNNGSRDHFVSVYGYWWDQNNNLVIYIRDPGGNNYSTLKAIENGFGAMKSYFVFNN